MASIVQTYKQKYALTPKVSLASLFDSDQSNLAGLVSVRGLKEPLSASRMFTVDSRRVSSGDIYIAIPGTKFDGNKFVSDALNRGAKVIVSENDLPVSEAATLIIVKNARRFWSFLASYSWGHPGDSLKIIGVTGTNGKTSSVWMMRSLLAGAGVKVATIGTLGYMVGEELIPTSHTTPDPDVLFGLLKMSKDLGVEYIAMEVASHSIAQSKIDPLMFDAVMWTSFSQDHLDLHGTMEVYFQTKALLFTKFAKPNATRVIHRDVAAMFYQYNVPAPAGLETYALGQELSIVGKFDALRGTKIQVAEKSNPNLTWKAFETQIPMGGGIFAENFYGSFHVCASLLTPQKILFALSDKAFHLPPVAGRLEPVYQRNLVGRPAVFVDYAHTPDALEKTLVTAKGLTQRKLVVLFGCGGDRDASKRPIMGQIAMKLCDHVIITNDNPRTEDPSSIAQQIEAGCRGSSYASHYEVILDRSDAIVRAMQIAGLGDTVIIAGKGHEDYQILGNNTVSFSDQKHAYEALAAAKSWCVVGLGVSGLAAAVRLASQGDQVIVSDSGAPSEVTIAKLREHNIAIHTGGHHVSHLDQCTGLVLSPGIAKDHVLVKEAKTRGLSFVTEIDLGFDGYQGNSVLITGTNGKSTVCALINHGLIDHGLSSVACGNFGLPPSSLTHDIDRSDSWRVCELSSYQLEQSLPITARSAVFTSFSNDHVARHKTLDEYFRCKWRMVEGLSAEGLLVIRASAFHWALQLEVKFPGNIKLAVVCDTEEEFNRFSKLTKSSIAVWYVDATTFLAKSTDGTLINWSQSHIKGHHNHINLTMSALVLNHELKMDWNVAVQLLNSYKGLPYRCQIVGTTSHGELIINDSKSTNVESTLVALSLLTKPGILMVGGVGKGEPYQPLLSQKNRIAKILCFGEAKDAIYKELSRQMPCESFATLAAATARALELSKQSPMPILFSPAGASFDEFKNYEHRGSVFSQLISSKK
jgi:UDP-N-acetylmuramoyl-L-alanyl-D-glutamate--2,6-diaminopimelate ligase